MLLTANGRILGWSALSGVVVVLVAYVFNYPLAKYNIYVRSCELSFWRELIEKHQQITRNSWKAKDSRMNVVNELLQNIRFLKFYGWGQYAEYALLRVFDIPTKIENRWANKSRQSRDDELKWRVKENTVDTLISFIWYVTSTIFIGGVQDPTSCFHRIWMPSATALTCFLCYTLIAGLRLTVSKAFTSIALFSQLQGPMTALPGQLFAMLHGK